MHSQKLIFMKDITKFFDSGFGSVLKAIVILILAFVVAAIVKMIVVKLLNKTKLAHLKTPKGETENTGEKAIALIGKLTQLIVFLLFIPGIFEVLGLSQVSSPILSMLNTVWGYIPQILAAIIILWIGFYVARLVREILIPVLNKLEVNKLQKVAGIEVSEQGQLSNTLAYIVYVLILIPVIITALQVLNIKAISDPAISTLDMIFRYIPYILAALVIVIIGWILAKFIGNIVTRLIEASGLDAKLAKLTGTQNRNLVLSEIIGKTVQAVLVIFFIVESFSALHLGVLTKIGLAIIAYMPELLTAALILAAALFLGALVFNLLKKNDHATAGLAAKYLIWIVAAFMILNQLGIAKTLVDSAFILAIAAVAVAFALSFGIGGRDFAKSMLAALQKKFGWADGGK